MEKLRSYDGGLSGFPLEAVLILTERTRSLERLSENVHRADLSLSVLAAVLDDVNADNFFDYEFAELPGSAKRKPLESAEDI